MTAKRRVHHRRAEAEIKRNRFTFDEVRWAMVLRPLLDVAFVFASKRTGVLYEDRLKETFTADFACTVNRARRLWTNLPGEITCGEDYFAEMAIELIDWADLAWTNAIAMADAIEMRLRMERSSA